MKKIISIIILSIIYTNSMSQISCGMHTSSQSRWETCNDWCADYEHVNTLKTPIKQLRVTFHICQDDNGMGNFKDNATHRDFLINQILRHMNSTMSGLEPMNLATSSPYVEDSRIRFVLANIYFHQDNKGFCYAQKPTYGNYVYNKFVTQNPDCDFKDNSVHIFFGEDTDSTVTSGIASGFGDKRWVAMGNTYRNFLNGGNFWSSGTLLCHELGHSLGLTHTWDGDHCSDTPDNTNIWCSNLGSNNMMDYNCNQNSLTECQVHHMHWHLLGNNGNISDCLINSSVSISAGEISGNNRICHTGATYTLTDHKLGTNIEWSVSPASYFENATGCGSIINLTPINSNISGSATLNVTVKGGRFGNYSISKNIWVGKPDFTIMCPDEVPVYMQGIAAIIYPNDTPQAVTSVDWSCSGDIQSIVGGLYVGKFRAGKNPGYGFVYALASNTCGSVEKETYVEVTGDWHKAYPNPANDYVVISFDQKAMKEYAERKGQKAQGCELVIYDNYNQIMYKTRTKDDEIQIDTRNFPAGTYYLHVTYGDKTEKSQLVIE
ncbi:MAG: hypothetical protein CSB01_00110 [Bacteroidia bacterium]|nr:MAG: hypothetical protein CSB01_00110 [Bacteroidia bacterium]